MAEQQQNVENKIGGGLAESPFCKARDAFLAEMQKSDWAAGQVKAFMEAAKALPELAAYQSLNAGDWKVIQIKDLCRQEKTVSAISIPAKAGRTAILIVDRRFYLDASVESGMDDDNPGLMMAGATVFQQGRFANHLVIPSSESGVQFEGKNVFQFFGSEIMRQPPPADTAGLLQASLIYHELAHAQGRFEFGAYRRQVDALHKAGVFSRPVENDEILCFILAKYGPAGYAAGLMEMSGGQVDEKTVSYLAGDKLRSIAKKTLELVKAESKSIVAELEADPAKRQQLANSLPGLEPEQAVEFVKQQSETLRGIVEGVVNKGLDNDTIKAGMKSLQSFWVTSHLLPLAEAEFPADADWKNRDEWRMRQERAASAESTANRWFAQFEKIRAAAAEK